MEYDNDIASLYPSVVSSVYSDWDSQWIWVQPIWVYETYQHDGGTWHRIESLDDDIITELEKRGYENFDGYHIPDDLYTFLVLKYG